MYKLLKTGPALAQQNLSYTPHNLGRSPSLLGPTLSSYCHFLGRHGEKEKSKERMKTLAMDYFGEAEDQSGGVTVAMDVDDVDSSLDLFGEGPVLDLHRLADSDFFNSFQDDFDDEDIN
ncbi:hypothetical protein Pfo_016252 [Paulownia fortunei]|nr:hypothetical protein Pfo_016252 [Paulownia fortunei]